MPDVVLIEQSTVEDRLEVCESDNQMNTLSA